MKKDKTEEVKPAPKAEEQFAYIGESIVGAGLLKYRIYRGGKPAIVAELKAKYPLIDKLFVPVEDIDKARLAVETRGSLLYLANEQIIDGGEI